MAQFDGVSKEAFVGADQKTSRELMYDMLAILKQEQKELIKRKNFDTAMSAFFGMVGGAIAIFAKTIIGKA